MSALPCPVLDSCESCGTPDDLAVVEADTPVGTLCFTLCGACEDTHSTPRLPSWTQAIYRVLEHCDHTGRPVDEPTDQPGGAR